MNQDGNPSLLGKAEMIWKAALAEVAPENLIRKSVKLRGAVLEITGIQPISFDTLENPLLLPFLRRGLEGTFPGLPPTLVSKPNHASEYIKSKTYDLSAFDNIYLIAFGKAAPAMAASFLDILGGRVRSGLVVILPGQIVSLPKMVILEAPHPLPDERSSAAARAALEMARMAGEKDLVVILLSGGGSAQLALPRPPVTLDEKKLVTRELLLRGADIHDLNIVRKHLSAVKGGLLAKATCPAEVAVLAISDVVGDDPGSIASGPAHWDSSTFAAARRVLRTYDLWESAPPAIREIFDGGYSEETPKKKDPVFDKISPFLIGNNAAALDAAQRRAKTLGFETYILTSSDHGEAKEAARNYAALFADLTRRRSASARPLCLLIGGELTVRVTGRGQGGRNQEFILALLTELERQVAMLGRPQSGKRSSFAATCRLDGRDWLAASLGTDGIDGNTDAAGAWAAPQIFGAARTLGLNIPDFLADNDSYHFFQKAGGLIVTGPTGTNVMDVRLFLSSKQRRTRSLS